MPGARPLIRNVVKLGGNVVELGAAERLLEVVSAAGRKAVVVPGGGRFADAVRDAQKRLGFSDAAAHDMAILAMHQNARLLCDLAPWLCPAELLEEIQSIAASNRTPVWLPLKACKDDAAIPRDWSITSDGLAARLAERLGGAHVVLVKSCDVPGDATPAQLAELGITDRVFAQIVERAGLGWRVIGCNSPAALAEALA